MHYSPEQFGDFSSILGAYKMGAKIKILYMHMKTRACISCTPYRKIQRL